MITGRSISILLVDDDEEDYLMFKDLLSDVRDVKFSIDWAHSYETGKASLETKAYDVCFLDYRLGAHTGLDLLKEAVANGTKTPMILLTGYGEPEVDREAMRVGAADYLVKDQINPLLLERSIRYSIHRAANIQALLEREAQIVLQDRLASVGLLASSLAHEIGNPLGIIRGRAEYLEIQLPKDEGIKKNVDIIIHQIDRVSKLIHSLLNLARGNQTLHAGRIHLNETVSEVLDLLGHEFNKQGIRIQNELREDLPVRVRAEAGPLHQVVLNLLINSIHAIDSARKSGRTDDHFVRISAEREGSHWIISVEDTGCGISEKNMKNLFKPFFTTKDIGVGTGLGLATSYGIVESWGGKLEAKSTEGVGTTFQIRLPRAGD